MLDSGSVKRVLDLWNISLAQLLPADTIPGSPERCKHRLAFADRDGHRFILEQLDPISFNRKMTIAERLDQLARSNLTVTPYCQGSDGNWVQKLKGACWQLSPYVDGIRLDRTSYFRDAWRGEAVGHFLADLSNATCGWTLEEPFFSMTGFIDNLMASISRSDPLLIPEVNPIYEFLRKRLYPVIDDLPITFGHGDPHPLNTIWGEDCINSVIDWEFCGWKPKLYDAALVAGCVGAEAPEAREAEFVSSFLRTLRQTGLLSLEDMALFPLFVLAVRFGWLSEWLRKKDDEMIDFELFYMRLLMDT